MQQQIKKIRRRDGSLTDFEQAKITQAIFKALTATGQGDGKLSYKLSDKVVKILNRRFKGEDDIPGVEQIQDIVEEVLILEGFVDTAKAYILYREQRRRIREAIKVSEEAVDRVDQYLEKLDWEVKENANMAFSLQGLNHYGVSYIVKRYWLNKIYPKEIRGAVERGDFHIHNLDCLAVYCSGWDLYDFLIKGFGGVTGKIQSKPPKHLRTTLGQVVNFLYTIQGEIAGAVAFSFDPQTPITIKRNENVESVTLEMLFEDYEHLLKKLKRSEVIFTNNLYRRYSIDEADKRKYLDSRMPTEPVLFQKDKIEVLTEKGFQSLKAISRHKIETADDKLLIIETEDGNILRLTRSHPVIMADGSLKKAKGIKEGDILLSIRTNFQLEEKIEIQNDFAYLIGFMIAEGCWGHQTRDYSLTSQKRNTKERKKIKHILEKLKIPYYDQGEFNIVFGTTKMGRFIRNHLRLQAKSYRKNLPSFVFSLKKENIGALISGLIDGDGDIDRGKTVRINSTSYTLLMQLKQLLGVLGINSTIRYISSRNAKGAYNRRDIYIIKFKIEDKYLSLFKESIKTRNNIRSKKKSSPLFTCKVVKIVEAKKNSNFVYDITTANNHFVINNIVVHNSNFDTLLAPFIRYDNLDYQQVKQALQEFLYNMAIPTRVGFQNPFSNITLDLKPSIAFVKQPVIIGGKPQKETYSEFEEEMRMFDKALYEVMLEGDKLGRPFHFPIPTINITKDFPWSESAFDGIFEASAKYGTNYFANYINSEMKPEDVKSMCCRLRIDLTELYNRGGGGLFGSGSLTGSIGVVTINFPRIGYLSKTKKEFFERLAGVMDLAKESLEIKRKAIENYIEKGLYPFSRYYLQGIKKMRNAYYANHFSTIGLIGMNEALLNFLEEDIGSANGKKFTLEVLDFMREILVKYQEETGNLYNLEATPAEGTSYRLALKDKENYPDIITAGTKETPYYTNSTMLSVNYTDDIFEALKLQDEIQCEYTGGVVLHLFLGERMPNSESVKKLVKKVFENFKLPYITLTPTFSICLSHGYLEGEHFFCPKCTIKQPCEVYSRVVGYYRPVQQFNVGKQKEFHDRKVFKLK